MVSNTYYVVFLLCFSSSCVPYVASFSGLSVFDYPFVLCTLCCQFLWIVRFWLPLRLVASFSGLSVFDYPFVLCTLCCQFLWIVRFWLPLRLVYPMLPVSMDSPSLIATSVFPYVYLPKHITKPVRYVDILNNNYLKNIRHITISEEL